MTRKILLMATFLAGYSAQAMTTEQATQACQAALAELGNTLMLHNEQHSDMLNQMNAAIEKLQNMLAMEQIQNQKDEKTIVDLRSQLLALEQQKDQEIAALQTQLTQSALELELFEHEYNEFINTCLAYGQNLYNMLQLIKKEYMGLLDDQDEFFQSLELIIDKVQTQAEDMTTEVYDALQNVT